MDDDRAYRFARTWTERKGYECDGWFDDGQSDCVRRAEQYHPCCQDIGQGRYRGEQIERLSCQTATHADWTLWTITGVVDRCRRPQGRASTHLSSLWTLSLEPDFTLYASGTFHGCFEHLETAWRYGYRMEPGMEDELLGKDVGRQPRFPDYQEHVAPIASR